MIFDPDFTVSLGDEVELCCLSTLTDNGVFWHVQLCLDVVDEEVDDLKVAGEDFVLFNGGLENVLSHLKTKGRWNDAQEFIKFFLVVKIAICKHHEFSHLPLQVLWQLHVLHTRVSHINVFLKFLTFYIHGLSYDSDCTENIGVDKCSKDYQCAWYNEHEVSAWIDIVTSQCQDRCIEGYIVPFIPHCNFWTEVISYMCVVNELSWVP